MNDFCDNCNNCEVDSHFRYTAEGVLCPDCLEEYINDHKESHVDDFCEINKAGFLLTFFKSGETAPPFDDQWWADVTWTYKTDIPHETFNIHDDNELYCTGIVFYAKDAGRTEPENKPLTLDELKQRINPIWKPADYVPEKGYWCLCHNGMITEPSGEIYWYWDDKAQIRFYGRKPEE